MRMLEDVDHVEWGRAYFRAETKVLLSVDQVSGTRGHQVEDGLILVPTAWANVRWGQFEAVKVFAMETMARKKLSRFEGQAI